MKWNFTTQHLETTPKRFANADVHLKYLGFLAYVRQQTEKSAMLFQISVSLTDARVSYRTGGAKSDPCTVKGAAR
jgi:hypothetical protein